MSRVAMAVNAAHSQSGSRLRFEWGLQGAGAVISGARISVVIDVLSFTTALSYAIDAGMEVFPYRWKDASAEAFARERDATLATSRAHPRPGGVTLSPASIRKARGVERLVLPSPNGSTIAHVLAAQGTTVLAACLRNRSAVAAWIDRHADRDTDTVAIIAAGERWPDASLRPAVEDLWGAGGVIAALYDLGWTVLSPEARMAMAAFADAQDDILGALRGCASGRELIEIGFGEDVDDAAVLDASPHVPILRGDRFIRA